MRRKTTGSHRGAWEPERPDSLTNAPNLDQRCQAIRLILSDVDGVLTDGGIVFDNQGIETKRFHVRDGMGIRLWHKAGYRFGLITHRSSHIVKMRVAELEIEILRQGIDDKMAAMRGILKELGSRRPRSATSATICPTCRWCGPWGSAWPWPTPASNSARRPTTWPRCPAERARSAKPSN